MLDGALDRQVDALEQHLAGEQRAIERASAQDGIGHLPESTERFGRRRQSVWVGTAPAAPTPRGTVDQTGLVERASQGDHEAFGMLVGAHLARLDTAARLILRDPELARDAVQEATLRAWRNLRGLRDPDRFDAWLHRLTVNACLDLARQRRSRVIEVELTPLHDAPVPDATSRVTDAMYVERMLATLDPAQRAVVVLHYYLDLSLPETAAALGIPVGTAKSRLNRALDAMRIKVADDELLDLVGRRRSVSHEPLRTRTSLPLGRSARRRPRRGRWLGPAGLPR